MKPRTIKISQKKVVSQLKYEEHLDDQDIDKPFLFDNRNKAYPYWRQRANQVIEEIAKDIGHDGGNEKLTQEEEEERRHKKVFLGSLAYLNNCTSRSKVNAIL